MAEKNEAVEAEKAPKKAAAPKAAAEKKPEESKPEEKKKLSETVKGGKWTWVVDFEDFGAPVIDLFFVLTRRRRV